MACYVRYQQLLAFVLILKHPPNVPLVTLDLHSTLYMYSHDHPVGAFADVRELRVPWGHLKQLSTNRRTCCIVRHRPIIHALGHRKGFCSAVECSGGSMSKSLGITVALGQEREDTHWMELLDSY